MKERLTITLDKDLLSEIDATIDGVATRNRSHAIEKLLRASITGGRPAKAVVFAGGRPAISGGRAVPMPMVAVNGRPVIDYILDELKRNRISEVIVVAGMGSEGLLSHLGDGSRHGLGISYVIEETERGTEGALWLVREKVRDGPFFALNGDNIFTIDLDEVYRQHLANRALATVALTPSDLKLRFGVTKLEGNKVTSFVQKHDGRSGAALVNAGIYLFSSGVFDFIKEPKGRVMLEESLFPTLVSKGRLFGYVFSGPWRSIDAVHDTRQARKA